MQMNRLQPHPVESRNSRPVIQMEVEKYFAEQIEFRTFVG